MSREVKKTVTERNSLVEKYRGFVRHVAGSLVSKFCLPKPMFDELESAGYLGLIESAERFDSSAGQKFETYAYLRIRGAMIDSMRECADLPGDVYRSVRVVRAVQQERLNALASEEDLISGLNEHQIPDVKLARILDYVAKGGLIYRLAMSEVHEEIDAVQDARETPHDSIENEQFWTRIIAIINELPEKEQLIVREYYFRGRSFQEIAELHEGMSKSWISRLHTRAIDTIKKRFFETQTGDGDRV